MEQKSVWKILWNGKWKWKMDGMQVNYYKTSQAILEYLTAFNQFK